MSELKYRRPRILDLIPPDRHALIDASAGTGKTFLLENLVIRILVTTDATIDRILAVTFTEKATGELRARIRAAIETTLAGVLPPDIADGEIATLDDAGSRKLEAALFSFDRAPVYTIHSFCQRTLSDFAFLSRLRFKFDLIDKETAFHEAFRTELREHFATGAADAEVLGRWLAVSNVDRMEKLLYEAHRLQYSAPFRPSRSVPSIESAAVDVFLPRIERRMEATKRERGVLDYDDMLKWLADEIDGPQGSYLVEELRRRYRFALIDEFQDTDELQWRIFRRIFLDEGASGVLHLIGDPKQAIYAFRNADVYAYLAARAQLQQRGIEPIPLIENFRSTEKLITSINLILDQTAAAPFFPRGSAIRYEPSVVCARKDFRAVDGAGRDLVPVTLMKLSGKKVSAATARDAIGRYIARTLRSLLNDPARSLQFKPGKKQGLERLNPKDIFVLTRSNDECEEAGGYLRDARIPFAFYKQEGLFQTREAGDVADALHGVLEPEIQSRRLKAWASPFFAIPFRDLRKAADASALYSPLERLYQWKSLAEEERFADLFDEMLHGGGLANRELLLADSDRALTNYQHIFEILLESAVRKRLSLADLIELLGDFTNERANPEGDDRTIQRLESEREAVQIMTVHKAKGLQASMVFLFGGTHRSNKRGDVAIYHDPEDRRRMIAIGKSEIDAVKATLDNENDEESRRLTYVAITRARAKLYLPYFPEGATSQKLSGVFKHLNERLKAIAEKIEAGDTASELFEIEDVVPPVKVASESEGGPKDALCNWNPPKELLDDAGEVRIERELKAAREGHEGLAIRSYTSLRAARGNLTDDFEPDDFKAAPDGVDADLAGGRAVGIYLHEAIEKLDLTTLSRADGRDAWIARGDMRRLFESLMRQHGVGDPRWLDRGLNLVWNALTTPVALGGKIIQGGLHRCENLREMEFAYPIPEQHHSLLGRRGRDEWTAERGYLKGVVDFIFEYEGLTYFADWKSDLMASYESAAIAERVANDYAMQAEIYTTGIIRLLGIRTERDYQKRFGGLAYIFLRGIDPAGDGTQGVHFIRPSWNEVVAWEKALIAAATGAVSEHP
ncbi:MAG TPA: UvrD-helicase domain-containing protein [Candidatus Binataceae bacterium]|nr:UvrD-helicase domain-containing protein [Candidatus Binataceae bacterium]